MIELIDLNSTLKIKRGNNDVLCIGELLVDMIANDYSDDVKNQSFNPYFGGSPANIAINTNRLGLKSTIVASVGEDRFGDYLIEHLERENMNTDYVMRSPHSTSMVVLNRSKATPIPTFYRQADFQLNYTPAVKQLLSQSSILHISSWPASKMPARQCINDMIVDAKKEGVLIGFDPNYHSTVWSDDQGSTEYLLQLMSQVDVIKPSLDDAERIFGIASIETQMQRFLDTGVKLVILTLGSNGALISNGQEMIHLPSLATEVVDTTGAGDAFWSGFYTGIIKQYSIFRAIHLGLCVSAYKLRFVGATTDLPEISKIQKEFI